MHTIWETLYSKKLFYEFKWRQMHGPLVENTDCYGIDLDTVLNLLEQTPLLVPYNTVEGE